MPLGRLILFVCALGGIGLLVALAGIVVVPVTAVGLVAWLIHRYRRAMVLSKWGRGG